jgi:hypothetical protein
MEHRFCYPSVTPLPRRPIDGALLPPAAGLSAPSSARVWHSYLDGGSRTAEAGLPNGLVVEATAGPRAVAVC